METKVLSAIMKLQAAQIMLSNEGLYNSLNTDVTEYGSLKLSVYVRKPNEAAAAIQILNSYTFDGAELKENVFDVGTPDEFTTYTLFAFISKIQD